MAAPCINRSEHAAPPTHIKLRPMRRRCSVYARGGCGKFCHLAVCIRMYLGIIYWTTHKKSGTCTPWLNRVLKIKIRVMYVYVRTVQPTNPCRQHSNRYLQTLHPNLTKSPLHRHLHNCTYLVAAFWIKFELDMKLTWSGPPAALVIFWSRKIRQIRYFPYSLVPF